MMRIWRNHRGLLPVVLLVIVIALVTIGGSAAYFSGVDEVTNTFTMGKIKITLDEPGWSQDAGLDLKPGSVKTKDPTVTAEKGKSYMRIRMEIVDGESALITDPDRLDLILSTLFYDKAYGTASPNLKESQMYTKAELEDLVAAGEIFGEYNKEAFAFAGIEKDKPAVRYYNYIANGGLFDASKTPADTAVLFTGVVIPKDWIHNEIFDLNGDTYELGPGGGLEVTVAGSGYKIRLTAEAIQSSEMADANQAFLELDDATGVTREEG